MQGWKNVSSTGQSHTDSKFKSNWCTKNIVWTKIKYNLKMSKILSKISYCLWCLNWGHLKIRSAFQKLFSRKQWRFALTLTTIFDSFPSLFLWVEKINQQEMNVKCMVLFYEWNSIFIELLAKLWTKKTKSIENNRTKISFQTAIWSKISLFLSLFFRMR